MIVGYDGRTCDASLEGTIRYNSTGGSVIYSGPAYCWGADDSGQIGVSAGSDTNNAPTSVVAGGYNWVQISASEEETCGITDTGDAYCWGNNSDTNLGTDSCCTNAQTPVLVVGSHSWTQISVGMVSVCGIATDGKAYCWGNNDYQQEGEQAAPGDGSPTIAVNESTVTGTAWIDVAAGDAIACGIRDDGTAWCWGGDDAVSNARGCGGCSQSYIPQAVTGSPSGSAWIDLDVNYDFGCGIRDNNTAWCWGNDGSGQLGNGAGGASSTPVAVSGGLSFISITTGLGHACAVTTTGDGYCWGSDTNGRLGNGSGQGSKTSPYLVTGSHTWAKIEAGHLYTCGLTTAGVAYCWGYGTDGEIGDGANMARQDPTLVNGAYTWADVTAAKTWQGMHSCGIVASGGTIALAQLDYVQNHTNYDLARGVTVYNNYAYLSAEGGGGVASFSTADPANLTQADFVSATSLDAVAQMAGHGNYLYVVSWGYDVINIIDVTDPANMSFVSAYNPPTFNGLDGSIAVSGNFLYVIYGSNSIGVIDISNPTSPVERGHLTDATYYSGFGLEASGNYVYVASYGSDRFTIVDVSDPDNLVRKGSVTSANLNGVWDVNIKGTVAYVYADLSSKLVSIDVSDVNNPAEISSVTNAWFSDVSDTALSGDYVYVLDYDNEGIAAVDISNPASMQVVDTQAGTVLFGASAVAAAGRYLYATADGDDTIVSFDTGIVAQSSSGSAATLQFCDGANWTDF